MENHAERSGILQRRDATGHGDIQWPLPSAIAPSEQWFTWERAVRTMRGEATFILACAGALTLGFLIFAFMLRDTYQPTARLEIDPPGSGIKTLHEIDDTSPADNQDYLDTQVQVLQSDSLATKVIRALHLDKNNELVNVPNTEAPATAQNRDSTSLPRPSKDAGLLQDQSDLADRSPSESAALGVFRRSLAVNPIRGTRLIEVSFASYDPALAQLVTNTLVRQFIEQNHRDRYTSTMEASDWLSTQLNDLREKVEQSNRAVAEYQKRYNLVEMDDHDLPMTDLMSGTNRQLSDAEANRIEAEAYVRMVENGQSGAIPAYRDDQVYQNLLTRYGEVRAQLAEAKAVYGDENSNVKKLTDEANELAAQVDAERTRMANQLRAAYRAALDREQMMLDSRNKLLSQMGDASSHLVEYRVLKNEALANAELYNTLQARLREAGIYAGLGSDNIHIVDLAPKLRRATSPHRSLIIGMGTIFSCLFAVVLAFVRESFDNTVRTPEDIRETTGLPSLAMVPSVRNGETRLGRMFGDGFAPRRSRPHSFGHALWMPTNTLGAEALRHLRTSLMLVEAKSRPRVILVSSPSAGEGKSTVALNLAAVLAQQGRACLIEGDLRRPASTSSPVSSARPGLTEVLAGRISLDDALVHLPQTPRLTVLPSGKLPASPADLIASEHMRALITELRQRFDQIVIDSPPVIPFSEARYLSSLSDAVVLVSRYRSTTRRALVRCFELFDEVNAPVVGVVLNGINHSSADYQYFNYGYRGAPSGNSDDEYGNDTGREPNPPEPKAKAKSAGS